MVRYRGRRVGRIGVGGRVGYSLKWVWGFSVWWGWICEEVVGRCERRGRVVEDRGEL